MKQKIIVANWKMQINTKESMALTKDIKDSLSNLGLGEASNVKIILCPSFTAISEINKICEGSFLKLGGQNVFWEETGAYTGAVSPEMLKENGCEFVIVGHSDRRKYFHENEEMIHYKIRACLRAGLTPILCIGETFQERQDGRKEYVIINQLNKALSGLDLLLKQKIIVAYEPVWVIGSGRSVGSEEVNYMSQVVKQTLIDIFPISVVEGCFKIIYGGSVDKKNVKSFLIQGNISGVLVGGASLNSQEFLGIIQETNMVP